MVLSRFPALSVSLTLKALQVNQGQPQGVLATAGVDLAMTTLGEKLQQARWYTAWFGKWQ